MKAPRSNSKAYPIWVKMQEEEERLRPKSNTNWTHPFRNFFAGILALSKALASGENAKLEKRWNQDCVYPIRINPEAPWDKQVSKIFKHQVWVVVLYYNHPKYKAPIILKVLNFLAYPLKYIPQKSILRMPSYTNYCFRIGSVINGFEVEFKIPKKFSFK
jgi:hypothetical protein